MALKNQINEQLAEAMKAKEETKVSVLRMLKAAILKHEVSGDRTEASDENVLDLIQKEIKSRRDSAEQYRKGNRPELADKEEKEIEILLEYMPPQMTKEEVIVIAKEVIAETGAQSKADLGRVMGKMMPKVKGQADGNLVSEVVNSLLA